MLSARRIVALLLMIMGAVWFFQGLGWVGGSFMTGASEWIYIGLATAIAGFALLLWRPR